MSKKPPLTVIASPATGPAPPRKLGEHGRALWDAVQSAYRIDDVGGTEVLMQVCQTADRAEALAARIDADGETLATKAGVKAHPGLRDELACRAFVCKGLDRLGINVEAVRPPGRPAGQRYG